jgi:hypothetical protein
MADPQYPFFNRDKRQIWDKIDSIAATIVANSGVRKFKRIRTVFSKGGIPDYTPWQIFGADINALITFPNCGGPVSLSGTIRGVQVQFTWENNANVPKLSLFIYKSSGVPTYGDGDVPFLNDPFFKDNLVAKIDLATADVSLLPQGPIEYPRIYSSNSIVAAPFTGSTLLTVRDVAMDIPFETDGSLELYGYLVTTDAILGPSPGIIVNCDLLLEQGS